MTDSLFDLVNPPLVDTYAEEFGVPASSPRAVGAGHAGQTGQTITTEGWSAPKQVAATSVNAYRELQDTLPAREQAVLIGLRRFWARHQRWPTAYEVFSEMKADGVAFDLNSVRPRLTSLFQHGRVTREAKRVCRITGKFAYTWSLIRRSDDEEPAEYRGLRAGNVH